MSTLETGLSISQRIRERMGLPLNPEQISIETAPRLTQVYELPQELLDAYTAVGFRLSWQWRNEDSLSQHHGQKIHVLLPDHIARDFPALWERLQARSELYVDPITGRISRGDWVLCIQAQTDNDYWSGLDELRWQRRKDATNHELDTIKEFIERELHGAASVSKIQNPTLEEQRYVRGS